MKFDFGHVLRAYRLARRMNQDELARQAGLSRQAISDLENAKAVPRSKTLEALCVALDIPVTALDPPDVAELPGPPVVISPWPPHGITWEEVQLAISDYVTRRTAESLRRMNDRMASEGIELVVGEPLPLKRVAGAGAQELTEKGEKIEKKRGATQSERRSESG